MLMKTNALILQKTGSTFICNLFGHRYKTVRQITNHFHEYECSCCKKQITNDSKGRLIDLTPERKDINETLHYLFVKKHNAVIFTN